MEEFKASYNKFLNFLKFFTYLFLQTIADDYTEVSNK